ncbi:formylglycine-generating enzyme family protein [Desulfobacterales bacterium HSG16]|nr:formylglycine-generating enzyme family protein [Desulfobacterales bacterium HSG16]
MKYFYLLSFIAIIIAIIWISKPEHPWPQPEVDAFGKQNRPASKSSTKEIKKSFTNSSGMTFIYIPPGSFSMGSPLNEKGRYDRELQHEVTLNTGFYLQTTEVTQGQWKNVMRSNLSHFTDCGSDCPVESVSWNDVHFFVRQINMVERTRKYRLPTEAEWEYACRAGSSTPFNWGELADCSKANFGVGFYQSECKNKNPGTIMKVALFAPNAWGFYDMHGNVAEWCYDRFDDYSKEKAIDPVGGYSGRNRVYRGGSWGVLSRYCRSANRDEALPETRISELGFRMAMTP